MKNQAVFSLKDKTKKIKCRPLQFLFGALRVNLEALQKKLQKPVCFDSFLSSFREDFTCFAVKGLIIILSPVKI